MIKSIIIFFIILTNVTFAEIKKINIVGNARVSSVTIESLVDKKISNIDSIYINNLTKKIYDTDFFSDVKISFNQDVLTINVAENPVINFFYINGLSGDDLDGVNKIIKLKENSIFSQSKLKNDLEEIRLYFKTKGYYNSKIIPDVIKIENEQVNLILNIDKNDFSKIERVYFLGKKYFKDSELINIISSEEDSFWKLFTSSPFIEEKIDYDKFLLKEFYKSKGFYDVQIESAFVSSSNNKFTLTFVINSGDKYNFSNVNLKVTNKSIKEDDIFEIKNIADKFFKNKIYSSITISKFSKNLIKYLEDKKYVNYDLNIEELKKNEKEIEIIVQLNENKNFLINKINFFGNNITEERVIRDQMLISEGDYFDQIKLKNSIDKIKSKSIFKDVNYKLEDSGKKNYKDINIFVKEQPTGSISAGIGYSTTGALFDSTINERNFLGKGINLNFNLKGSKEKINADINYLEPNFNNSNKDLIFSIYSTLDQYENSGFDNKRIGAKLGTRYEIYEDVSFRPSISLQYDKLEITSNGASNLIKKRAGSYNTNSLGYNFTVDKRDSKFNTTSGFVLYFDQNLSFFFSDIPAVESSFGVSYYKELLEEKFLGSSRLRIANVQSINTNKNVKLSDRLYASTADLRGFEPRGVGPVDSGDHVGGNNLVSFSLKSTFPNPIPESLRANSYVFFDLANVWGVDYSSAISQNSNKIRTSTGIGLDIFSPLGPLSFVYSFPITKADTDKEQKFTFNIGTSF